MTRLALDTLAVLTVCVKSQLALIEPVTLPSGVAEIGIRLVGKCLINAEMDLLEECRGEGYQILYALVIQ